MPVPSSESESSVNIPELEFKEEPKLYFPSRKFVMGMNINHDVHEIDNDYLTSFSACRLNERNWGSDIFWRTFENSKKITIIDKYLSEKELFKICEIVEKWKEEKTLAERELSIYLYKPEIKQEQKEILKLILELMGSKCNIYSAKKEHRDLLHDRFAIIDNQMFHFGGTVGGFQQGFTAFSYGWSNRKLDKLLDDLKSRNVIYEVSKL